LKNVIAFPIDPNLLSHWLGLYKSQIDLYMVGATAGVCAYKSNMVGIAREDDLIIGFNVLPKGKV
jgi:hypothetical protein